MERQTQEPLIETSDLNIPEDLKGLFCEPPPLEGEDPGLYRGLRGALIAERKPVTVTDWIALNDLVTKLWEERVYRRAVNAVVRGGMLQAVKHFMAEVRSSEDRIKSIGEATKYFSENANERNEIRSRLARYGITPAELHAKAAQQNSDALQMFERMINSRERSRRKLRREDDRRRREIKKDRD